MKRIARKLKNKARSRSGQAILEFALILPVLLIIIMGVLDFGWIFMNQYRVEKAASTAARYGAINQTQYKTSSTRPDYLRELTRKAVDNLNETGTVLCVDGTSGSQQGNHNEDSTVIFVKVNSNNVTVTVTYPVRTLTFVASTLFGRYYPATSTSVSAF